MKYKEMLGVSNAKTPKGEKLGYLTGIMYLAASTQVEGINVCKFASKGCKAACLISAGRGKFSNVKAARIKKTELFRDDIDFFMNSLSNSIRKLENRAKKLGLKPVVRLNGTSDIEFHKIELNGKNIFELYPNVNFYDYTKNHLRFRDELPKNYHLTFSLTENASNNRFGFDMLGNGITNIAIVFKDVPKTYRGFEVVDGDETDLRFLDKKNVIIGLKAKGDAKKDVTGFVK